MVENATYFIGILPPEDIRLAITAIKEYFEEKYGAVHSLKSPPHITMVPPFSWLASNELFLRKSLLGFCEKEFSFPVILKNFGAFPPRVIFINVSHNPELLSLHEKIDKNFNSLIKLQARKNINAHFNPHVTVAFKDLQEKDFKDAWETFKAKKIKFEFTANEITLFKHTGKIWNVCYSAMLTGK